jgi:hypothetical protein
MVVVQAGAVKIYDMWQQWRRSGKRKHRMKLCLPPKLVEKLVWVSVISFCKIFIPSYAYYVQTGRSRPPNQRTLHITLMCPHSCLFNPKYQKHCGV